MKARSREKSKSVILICMLIVGFNSYAQQQIMHTVTAQSRNCNSVCSVIDIPELNNNPSAIMLITPVGNMNPHPIGAYYNYLNKWSVFNLDAVAIAVGAQFNIEYYVNPDQDRFVFVVPQRAHLTDPAYIDHAGLNNNPGAQIRSIPHVSSTIGNIWNRYEVKFQYDATVSKWYILNKDNSPVNADNAYNIVTSGNLANNNNPPNSGGQCNCNIPTTLPPTGIAGGDLSGSYPNPSVKNIQGNAVAAVQPATGQVLKWNGTSWSPGTDETGTALAPAQPVSIQTYFKNTYEESPLLDNNSFHVFTNHAFTITVTKNSRLVISGNFDLKAKSCIACTPTKLGLAIYVNNAFKANVVNQEIASNSFVTVSVGNYMLDVTPGTYTINFRATHSWIDGNTAGTVAANFSSVMVIPQ